MQEMYIAGALAGLLHSAQNHLEEMKVPNLPIEDNQEINFKKMFQMDKDLLS